MLGNKLKCFFAFSDDILNNQTYIDMLVATLKSARQNTTLDLHCLYDGSKSDKLYQILTEYDVTVHIKTIPFIDDILKIYTPEYMQQKIGYQISAPSLRARFLRMMVTDFADDEYILYCDTDILFLKDIKLSDFGTLPKYVGVCPEFEKSNNYTYFNAGVMLIHVPAMRQKYAEFLDMIKNGQTATTECCDQGYLNDLFAGLFDKLPLEYNWKPYYGYNPNAKIIHFHGIKPNKTCFEKLLFLKNALSKNDCIDAYYKYYQMFCEYAQIEQEKCLAKLTETLLCNIITDTIPKKKYLKLRNKVNNNIIILYILLCIVFIKIILW